MLKANTSRSGLLCVVLIGLFFCFLAWLVLTNNYLFTDEAHLLWHNREGRVVFDMFNTQGRYFTGILFEFLYRKFDTIESLRFIRLFSLLGWLITLVCFYKMLKKCIANFSMEHQTGLLYSILFFIPASLSFTVFISWAACAEIFFAALAGLYSGYTLFACLHHQKDYSINIPGLVWIKAIAAGIISLFFYQSLYPLMLLPFFLQLIFNIKPWSRKKYIIALGFYFVIYLVYYLLYTNSLRISHVAASTRTELHIEPLQKIAYFFSFPLNQAFNLNIPFDSQSLGSQLVFPVLAAIWVILLFVRNKAKGFSYNIKRIIAVLLFWLLSFLPQMITSENFGPYRTMLVLSLMVYLILLESVFFYIKTAKSNTTFVFALGFCLLVIGGINYTRFISYPLSLEYSSIKSFILGNYSPAIKTIVFVRPSENGFENTLGINNHKDELGMPSTSKDWVPEPLVKQILFESGISKEKLALLNIIQYTEAGKDSLPNRDSSSLLLIDVPRILKNQIAK